MSIFGKIMFVVALLWTFVAFMWYSTSIDFYIFMKKHILIITLGYVAIIVFTISMKRIVAGME